MSPWRSWPTLALSVVKFETSRSCSEIYQIWRSALLVRASSSVRSSLDNRRKAVLPVPHRPFRIGLFVVCPRTGQSNRSPPSASCQALSLPKIDLYMTNALLAGPFCEFLVRMCLLAYPTLLSPSSMLAVS